MMDKWKAAEIILQVIDENAPVTVNWNQKEWWINAIVTGLIEAEKEETPGGATPRESK
ncbi:hypothetical protein [Clostridium sp. E02]|uniref:hypothetical protein n=1 Tax=Clostridium sp. E02 TaxID=2487134 RepID=UPI0013DE6FBB|nr:hypothetical protein [Clostridium sp. E02]